MLHAGLDLCRRKVDVCLLNEDGEHVAGSPRRLTPMRCGRSPGASRSYTGSRFAV
jgi:hypothetical protein